MPSQAIGRKVYRTKIEHYKYSRIKTNKDHGYNPKSALNLI
jgi:hypothetical protein